MKGSSHLDYIIAMAIMILLFTVVVLATNSFLSSVTSEKDISVLSAQGLKMLSIADREHVFKDSKNISFLGIGSSAYRLVIVVNNTQPYLRNQSATVENITNELVSLNYTTLGFTGIDVNSTRIYDENKTMFPYNIDADIITFRTDINVSQNKVFIIYFDDDSNFTSSSSVITGINNLTERVLTVEEIPVIQYKKLLQLNETVYDYTKNITGIQNFRKILALVNGTEFFSYGGTVPAKGNVISLQRYVLFQNSTAGINKGRLRVQVW